MIATLPRMEAWNASLQEAGVTLLADAIRLQRLFDRYLVKGVDQAWMFADELCPPGAESHAAAINFMHRMERLGLAETGSTEPTIQERMQSIRVRLRVRITAAGAKAVAGTAANTATELQAAGPARES